MTLGPSNTGESYYAITKISDVASPNVLFSPNGGDWATSHSTTITVSDTSGVKSGTIKYTWSTSSSASASSGTATTSGSSLSKSDGTGTYYLCLYAEVNLGNAGTKCSSAFKIDNTGPTCSISSGVDGSLVYVKILNATDSDSGLHDTPYDFLSGDDSWQADAAIWYSYARYFKTRARDAVGNITVCCETSFARQYRWTRNGGSCYRKNTITGAESNYSYNSGYGTWGSSNSELTSTCQNSVKNSCAEGGLYTCTCSSISCSTESRFIKEY